MCPSHLIEWSLEWLTSYSMRSNSYCSTLHSQKHTVRTQKRSHMLEEMEPERPLVWICLLIDLNGNILHWDARNVSLVHVKFAANLQELANGRPPIRKQKVKHLVDLQCIEWYSYIYAQHKMILWQFSRIVQTVLVMAKWIIADCITSSWLWVNLCSSQCKHESEILSQVTQRLKGLQSQKVINRMLKMLAQSQHPSICCVPVKSWRVVEDCHSVICWRCLFGLFLSDLHSLPWSEATLHRQIHCDSTSLSSWTSCRSSEMVMVYLARLFQVPSSTASEPWTCSTLSERPWSLFKKSESGSIKQGLDASQCV